MKRKTLSLRKKINERLDWNNTNPLMVKYMKRLLRLIRDEQKRKCRECMSNRLKNPKFTWKEKRNEKKD